MLLSVGLAFLLENLDSTIKNEKDIEEILSLPVIGRVSLMKLEKAINPLARNIMQGGVKCSKKEKEKKTFYYAAYSCDFIR